MNKLNFYTVDSKYVNYLKAAENEQRGFSRVPNVEYSKQRKPKFLLGIVLYINDVDYYVPVTSFKQQKPDNFLIKADNGQVTSSLRFNYMFPIPKGLAVVRIIKDEPDRKYRALLAQELKYCIENQEKITHLAERTYKRVNLGLNKGLVTNSCAFQLLEQKCREYQV
jgi:protein AbiQ